jgi:Uma2 family endonuclease
VAIAATSRPFAADEDVHRLSTEEYERIVKTGALEDLRVELLDGLLVDMRPQYEAHVQAVHALMRMCRARLDLVRVQAPLAVGEGWVPEPDLALVQHEDRLVWPAAALFVAEVALSSHARDATKALVYARAGIPTYWIVDLPASVVRVHTQAGPDGYGSVVDKRGDDVLDAGVEGVEPTTVAALLAL